MLRKLMYWAMQSVRKMKPQHVCNPSTYVLRSENGHQSYQSAIQAFTLIALLEHFWPMGVAAVQVHV